MESTAIVLSGLPASGKTTVAKSISSELMYPLLDKDVFLEQLFDDHITDAQSSRNTLSRLSDVQFQQAAMIINQVVLVSHWRPIGSSSHSGTPTEWLDRRYQKIIEVHCDCTVSSAAKRFLNRERHEGHFDKERDSDEIEIWLDSLSDWFPLRIGTLIRISTEQNPDIHWLINRIRDEL